MSAARPPEGARTAGEAEGTSVSTAPANADALLAQASAYVGAVFVGVWAGVLAHVAPSVGRLQAAGGDTVAAVIGIVSSAALVAAGLWLESVCRVPPDEDQPTSSSSG